MSQDAICLSAFTLAGPTGRSWSANGDDYSLRLFAHDTEANARDLAGSTSSCATGAMAVLCFAEVDGNMGGVDRLRSPYAGHNDAPQWLERFAIARGLIRYPKAGERPAIEAGCMMRIGGDDGLPPEQHTRGGSLHVLTCTGVREDGTLDTIEGGQVDAGNHKPSPKNCTAIRACHREVYAHSDGSWWLRTAGDTGAGRKIAWYAQMGDAPCLPSAVAS
jgi:hypothetical protein